MPFNTLLTEHAKTEITRIIKNSGFTREYYIDQVLSVLHPDAINIVLYTARPDSIKHCLANHGFILKTGKDKNNIIMVYKNIVSIKIMTDQKEYDSKKIRNFRINSITLNHVIKQMAENRYSIPQMYVALEELAKHK